MTLRVAIDVDEVVADFVAHLLNVIASDKKPEDFRQWDLFGALSPAEKARAEIVLAEPGFWRTQPVVDGALRGVASIAFQKCEIFWVTRPWEDCAEWYGARVEWLRKHFGEVGCATRIAAMACKFAFRADILIDDRPDNLMRWLEENPDGKAILFTTLHNEYWCDAEEKLIRLDGWDAVARFVVSLSRRRNKAALDRKKKKAKRSR